MGLNSAMCAFHRRRAATATLEPYYGVGPVVSMASKNAAFITALPHRGPNTNRLNPSFTLDTETNQQTMYYAYPVSYGQAVFTDIAQQFQGGWDGAHGDFGQTLGPIIVPVMVGGDSVDFYLYQTDYPNLGSVEWSVT